MYQVLSSLCTFSVKATLEPSASKAGIFVGCQPALGVGALVKGHISGLKTCVVGPGLRSSERRYLAYAFLGHDMRVYLVVVPSGLGLD